jgi:hypothetical protein
MYAPYPLFLYCDLHLSSCQRPTRMFPTSWYTTADTGGAEGFAFKNNQTAASGDLFEDTQFDTM